MPKFLAGRRLGAGVAVVTTAALTFAGMPAAHAAPTSLGKLSDYLRLPAGVSAQITPNRWFVQTDGAPTAKGGNAATNRQQHSNVKNTAASNGLNLTVDAEYTDLWNGMAVTIPDGQVPELAATPGVARVFPILQASLPTPATGSEQDVSSQVQTGVNIAQERYGLTGKGIKVGVIDSGIDLDHKDLGGNGTPGQAPFPNARVKYGYDFVGDKYDAAGKNGSTTPVPDAVPDDCGGHGSHVAGIIGANGDPATGGVRGVAPEVTFGAYRVFGCEGNVDDDIVIKAMELAGRDGMDVINMSLGWSLGSWPEYPQAVAADNLVDRGTIVVDAMGNDGELGTFSGGAPGVGSKSIAVASVENTMITSKAFQINGRTVGYTPGAHTKAPANGSLDVVSAGPDGDVTKGTEPVGGCDAAGTYPVDPKGKALLVRRGACSFSEKARKAQNAGAAALVIYNRDDTTLSPALDPDITIPVYVISHTDGVAVQTILAGGAGTLTFGDWTAATANPQGGRISTFSSYGLAADLTLKPDIAAPGGNIWSTYPLEKGGYTNMSGTSMATPHVVGVIALLLQNNPALQGHALAVRDLLQNNATPLAFHLAPNLGVLDSTHVQGAGLVDLVKTLETKQFITPGKLSFGDDAHGRHTQELRISNNSMSPLTYTLTNETAVGTSGDTGNPSFQTHQATIDMPTTLTMPANSSRTLQVTVHAPKDAVDGELYGGFITLTAGDTVLHVPYAGMKGSYQQLPVLQNATDGTPLPALAKLDAAQGKYVPVAADAGKQSYNLTDNKPGVAFHLEYPVSGMQINVYSVQPNGKQKFLATIDTESMLGRDSSYLSLPWDGSYTTKIGNSGKTRTQQAKSGDYRFELKVQAAQPTSAYPESYQTWQSPVFHLDAT